VLACFVCSAQDDEEASVCPFSGGYTFRAYRNRRKMVESIESFELQL